MGAISEYLEKRKEKWLKNKTKADMSEAQIIELTTEAQEKFSMGKWIPAAAVSARQVSLAEASGIATHVCKFSHPDAKGSPIIARRSYKNDGYLHSGNSKCELDIFGNAAAAPVFDFLLATMDDGRTVIEHLESDSDIIRQELGYSTEKYEQVKADFLALKKDHQEIKSDERIKQVYFPVGDDYHLLSLLTSSGLVQALQDRVNEMRGKAISSRIGSNEDNDKDYEEIYDLTEIAFGGSKPQNISVLNSRNKGRAYLLSSCPPAIAKREITRPRQDFFSNTLQSRKFSEDFQYLHTLFICDRNNLAIRNKIKHTLHVIIDKVMTVVYQLREIDAGWSKADSYSHLPLAQKIWLDDMHAEQRDKDSEWLDEIALSFARWLIRAYEKVLKDDSIMLGDGEMAFLQGQVETALLEDKGIRG